MNQYIKQAVVVMAVMAVVYRVPQIRTIVIGA